MGEFINHALSVFEEPLRSIGFSERATTVAEIAARWGGRRLLALHGTSNEVLQIVYKADAGDTPVTIADRQSEEKILKLINYLFPDDQINAEESGIKTGTGNMWYVDPLDGTIDFTRGHLNSTVGTVVYKNNEPLAAAICQPFAKQLQVAERGKGAYSFRLGPKLTLVSEPTELHVSSKTLEDKGLMIFIDPNRNLKIKPYREKLIDKLTELVCGTDESKIFQTRTPGSNIDLQRQVAAGLGEVALTDFVGGPYDMLIGGFMIEEAGGRYTILNNGQVGIGSNGKFHDQLVEIVQECYRGYQGFK